MEKRKRDEEEGGGPTKKKGKKEEEEEKSKWEVTKLVEDDRILVVLKPQGLPTQGAKISLQKCDDLLLPWPRPLPPPTTNITRNKSSLKNKVYRKAEPVHRLDGATGGMVVCAKDKEANSFYKKLFEDRKIKKYYRAIVQGWMKEDKGEITFPISEKPSLTTYKVVSRTTSSPSPPSSPSSPSSSHITTVDIYPYTGRKHQIRRHLSLLGHPIVGEKRYRGLGSREKGGEGGKGEGGEKKGEEGKGEGEGEREEEGGKGDGKEGGEEKSENILYLWCLGLSFPLMGGAPTYLHPSITKGKEGEKEGEKGKEEEEKGEEGVESFYLPEPEIFKKLRQEN